MASDHAGTKTSSLHLRRFQGLSEADDGWPPLSLRVTGAFPAAICPKGKNKDQLIKAEQRGQGV